jgi:formylglycine-generating enzyme required for sulfatase activity
MLFHMLVVTFLLQSFCIGLAVTQIDPVAFVIGNAAYPPLPSSPTREAGLPAPGGTGLPVPSPELVNIPGGTFTMGSNSDPSEKPMHQVTIAPFALGKYPVTNGEWRVCFNQGDCTLSPTGDDDEPVHNISWDDTQQYVRWLGKVTDRAYRLPSEAEFEFAARGGADGSFWSGGKLKIGVADCAGCGEPYDAKTPQKVGTFKPNGYGLFDMAGNVEEWVADCWHNNYVGAPTDGSAWVSPKCYVHVLRGGSWRSEVATIRLTSRDQYDGVVRYITHGFRVALSL